MVTVYNRNSGALKGIERHRPATKAATCVIFADMSNAHCGDCLAGAIGSISVTCVYDSITLLYRCSPVDPAELWWPLGTVTPLRSVLLKYVLAGTEERRTRVAALQPVPHTRSHFESSPGASSRHSHSSVGTVVPTPCLALLGEAAMVGRCRHS